MRQQTAAFTIFPQLCQIFTAIASLEIEMSGQIASRLERLGLAILHESNTD